MPTKNVRGAALDDARQAGYDGAFMRRAVTVVGLVVALCGCQSDPRTRVLSPEKFVAATGDLAVYGAKTNELGVVEVRPRVLVPGMVVSIRVEEDRSLNQSFTIPNSGAIEFPGCGRMVVEGLTTEELAQRIKECLERDYFHTATVEASIEAVTGGGVVYVIGSVARPGPLALPKEEKFTVTKAIIAVGGCTTFGNCRKVQIIRYDDTGMKYKTVVNVDRIMKRAEFEKDVPLQHGDWIIVPEKMFNF
jgi:protein involved in polysaccharide export with SLBB domain